jgi:hypothetical protein
MPEGFRRILLDQNIPQALSEWLIEKLPGWEIQHVNTLIADENRYECPVICSPEELEGT